MRQPKELGEILIGGAAIALLAMPVRAATTPVTAVRLNQTSGGIELTLEANSTEKPQIMMVSSGNDIIANVLNSELRLPSGSSFRQDNPMPGIKSVVVTQDDANSIRVLVSGATNSPSGQIMNADNKGITLTFNAVTGNQGASASKPLPGIPTAAGGGARAAAVPASGLPALTPANPTTTAQAPVEPAQIGPPTGTQTPPPAPTPGLPQPSILVPNPNITIDGNPAPPAGVAQPVAPAPPFLPRAIAPPVGDIAVSNLDSSSSVIDLGTATRVPRLVLRDAPVREVLGLLARSAGLNLAFIGGVAAGGQGAQGAPSGPGGPTISLDIENEPVQDVFNYVLRLSALQANRSGNTIFVGTQLPQAARELVTRSFRLNQATASAAAGFLSAQGAESQQVVNRTTRTTTGEGADRRTTEESLTQIIPLAANVGKGPLLLSGLSVLTDERLNSLTMVGEPRQIEIASSMLTQLDARKRQVAVNVKIVDVNLLNTDDLNTSFSFGVGKSFFTVDGGAAVVNYGGTNPPSAATAANSVTGVPVIANPFGGANVFVDPNNPIRIEGLIPGTVRVTPNNVVTEQEAQPGLVPRPFINVTNPLQAGFTNFTPATPNIITETVDPTTGVRTVTTTRGTNATLTSALPSLFQFPTRLLSRLQAQIVSGNAKILTDPTLVIQENQTASVKLTQEVITNVNVQFNDTPGGTRQTTTFEKRDAGLILQVAVGRIDDNGFITLTVNPSVSAPVQTINTGQGGAAITLLSERTLSSGQIRLRDGQTLILSGIIQDSERTTISKVPILGDIPILGALFRRTNRENRRQEVIVLLTPQVIDDSSRSTFGYNYTPSPDARQILRRGGLPVQGGNR